MEKHRDFMNLLNVIIYSYIYFLSNKMRYFVSSSVQCCQWDYSLFFSSAIIGLKKALNIFFLTLFPCLILEDLIQSVKNLSNNFMQFRSGIFFSVFFFYAFILLHRGPLSAALGLLQKPLKGYFIIL